MKETISVNLASQAFTFDKDAYRRLKEYLDAIRRRLPAGDPEILNDVEARLAEIFRSRISSPMMVVTLQMVQGAMAQMGDPSEFGELPTGEKRDEASVDAESASCVNSRDRLDDPAPYHAVPDSFRRSVAVGLHHPVDRDPVGTFELYLFEI